MPIASTACTPSTERSEAACWAAASEHMPATRGDAIPGNDGFADNATFVECFLQMELPAAVLLIAGITPNLDAAWLIL